MRISHIQNFVNLIGHFGLLLSENVLHCVKLTTKKFIMISEGVHKTFAKITGKHLCQNLFLIKFQGKGLQIY